jgi:signal transduction histidine kinase
VLSRDKKPRASAQAAAQPTTGRPAGAGLALPGAGTAPPPAKPVHQASRRTLKNWRVRSRLLLLIIIPTLTAVVLGAISIVTSVQSALSDQQVEQLANLSQSVTQLAGYLGKEEVWTAYYIGLGAANGGRGSGPKQDGSALQNITTVQGQGKPWESDLQSQIAGLGSGYPAQVEADARNITALLGELDVLRNQSQTTNLPALAVVTSYSNVIDQLLAIDDNIALSSGDQSLATDVRALGLVSRIRAEVAQQGALLTYAYQAYQNRSFAPNVLAAVQSAQAEQGANLAQFDVSASPQQVAAYRNTAVGSLVDFSQQYEQTAIQLGANSQALGPAPYDSNEVAQAFLTGPDADLALLQQNLVTQTIDRASALRRDAIVTASVVGGGILIVLLLALLLTTVIGRSMVRPLRRLRSGALEIAGVRLPETVRQMSDSEGAAVSLDPEPIDVDSTDEIGEVARAFDQVHREAIRLAANEAALRGNVNAMFVNLSRRSQSLVERQIRLIDDLEQGEQDSDRLSSLFQMDHLATRMRRNSENLLVLAGHEATRRWNQPVALVDVLRAAVSEIEQYERVTLNVQPGIALRGHAVNDVVHLLAELAENATSFSSADTPVVVAGHLLSSGGVLLDITDQGVGMGAEEMAHANWRLDNPPVVDVAVSRRMGLFVVARLAARHGIRVRLRPAPTGGLTALVWLPDEVISHTAAPGAPGTRFDAAVPALVAAPAAGTVEDVISATEQEINAARAPRFASLEAEEGNGKLTARRVPGAGPRPGASPSWGAAATGPLPAFRSSPQPAGADGGDESLAGDAAGYAQPEPFGTSPLPAVDPDAPAPQADSPEPESAAGAAALVAAAGAAAAALSRPEHGTFGLDAGSKNGDVVIPPAEHVSTQNRLPIFEAVESDWFRRGRSGLGGWPGPQDTGSPEPTPMPEVAWATPSDQGWQAAAAVSAPSTGGTTGAGLPKRVPQANLVPGAAGATAAEQPPPPTRSAASTRDRFASFQRGSREGRAAATADDNWPDGEDGSR